MKTKIAIIISLFSIIITGNIYAEANYNQYNKIAEMVKNNWADNYIEDIKFNIGKNIMSVNGEEKQIDTDGNVVPTIYEGRTMLPARTIVEELGAEINFNPEDKKVKLEVEDIKMTLTIGEKAIEIAGEKSEIEVAPVIENGRTLLPVRAITENLGMGIEWNPEEQEITLTNDLQMKRIIVQATKKIDFSKYQPIDIVDLGDYLYILQFDTIGKTKKAYEEIQNINEVEYVELDKLLSSQSNNLIEDIQYNSWGAERIHVNEYINYLNRNNKKDEVVVAVIDTGIIKKHPIFENRIKEGGYNFLSEETGNLSDEDSVSHGTHVAGIIADMTQGTNVKILPIKVIGEDGSTSSALIVSAIKYAISQNVDVINISIAFDEEERSRHAAVNKAIHEGIVVVNSAGNENINIDEAAKRMSDVIFVGAINKDLERVDFSNYGQELDVVAPGVGVSSAMLHGYDILEGTSMAAPHVAAIAALYKTNNPKLTVKQIETLIKNNTDDLGDKGKDKYYGKGLPNMLKSIVKKVEWNKSEIRLKELEKTNIKLTLTYIDGIEEDITNKYNLRIEDESIATFAEDGEIIAIKEGETYITTDYAEAGKIKITVKKASNDVLYKDEYSEKTNTKWLSDDTYHWYIKSGRIVQKNKHIYTAKGICVVCGSQNPEKKIKESNWFCIICKIKAHWKQADTMHIAVCPNDNSHIVKIEGHILDNNNKCITCDYLDNKTYQSKFIDFQDTGHWAWKNVGHLAELGIVKGSPNDEDGTYSLYPNAEITAEAFIALLSRVLGYDGIDRISDNEVYMPLEEGRWSLGEWKYLMKELGAGASKKIQIALSNNSENGTDKEIVANYGRNITRERAAYLLGNFIKSTDKQDALADTFEDWEDVKSQYKEELVRLSAYDILRGNLENQKLYLNPRNFITRVEAIALIDRFYSLKQIGYEY